MEKRPGVQARRDRQSTLYVIAYDISDDRRRTNVHSILKGFGQWTEFSLFECFLT
ncbi:MAG TPA: CRISPR-associated endonuclease Cas2, partial [Ktedonobacteraceae bacterium]|nr:CRISPR-associated endonuclease Cas2 [Ktedonobacteraceae bacterium]